MPAGPSIQLYFRALSIYCPKCFFQLVRKRVSVCERSHRSSRGQGLLDQVLDSVSRLSKPRVAGVETKRAIGQFHPVGGVSSPIAQASFTATSPTPSTGALRRTRTSA